MKNKENKDRSRNINHKGWNLKTHKGPKDELGGGGGACLLDPFINTSSSSTSSYHQKSPQITTKLKKPKNGG